MALRRWWNQVIGIPARWLMRVLSRRNPWQEYDGLRLVVVDAWLAPRAEEFFDRTRQALARANSGAPQAYSRFHKDVRQVILWRQKVPSPYHKYQLAALVAPIIALEADTACYAAWLLHTSGLFYGQKEAQRRSERFLQSLEPAERTRVAEWLNNMVHRGLLEDYREV